jgi:hypothetical protein
VGLQKWKGFVSGDSAYKDNLSLEYNIMVVGELVNNVTVPDDNAYNRTVIINITGRVTDECGNPITGINDSITFDIQHQTNASSYSNCTSIVET